MKRLLSSFLLFFLGFSAQPQQFFMLMGSGASAQDIFRTKRVAGISAVGGGTSFTYYGYSTTANTGTRTVRSYATTDHLSSSRRVGLVSGAVAGNNAGERFATLHLLRGDAANVGGWESSFFFGIPETVTGRVVFVGHTGGTFQMSGSANPSASTNILGIAMDAADTEFQIMHNDGSGTATKVATGIALNTAHVYRLQVIAPSNGTTVDFIFTNITTGVQFTHTASTDLPAQSQLMAWQFNIGNGTTAQQVSLDVLEVAVITNH